MIYVCVGGVLRCDYDYGPQGWEWRVECISTGLRLAQVGAFAEDGWSIAEDNIWARLAAVLDGAAGDAPGTYQRAMKEAEALRRYAFKASPDEDPISEWLNHADPERRARDEWADFEARPQDFKEFWVERRRRLAAVNATRDAKASAIRLRRSEFGSARPALVLQLIEAGHAYVCGCGETDDLTVDHKVPLSRGGTDDLTNLQFLCRPCNSRKGAKAWVDKTPARLAAKG